jgi:transcriptional regulator with XRE-family HTH domain
MVKIRQEFGAQLKKRREEVKLSQGQIAMRLGYTSPQFISNIERGLAPFPDKVVKTYAKMLKTDPLKMLKQAYVVKYNIAKHRAGL